MPQRSDPFDLSDKNILDPEPAHVRVVRIKPRRAPDECDALYEKTFKADYGYWNENEMQVLAKFFLKQTKHVAKLQNLTLKKGSSSDSQQAQKIVTFDAGLTINHWLGLPITCLDGAELEHPFKRAEYFLHLTRASLEALKAVHLDNVIHCDIKADNICLPYKPYPFDPADNIPITPDFSDLRLIDFAFSVDRDNGIKFPLPISPTEDYQAPAFKKVLEAGIATGDARPFTSLHSSIDRFSLGVLLGEIFAKGLVFPSANLKENLEPKISILIADIRRITDDSEVDAPRDISRIYLKLTTQTDQLLKELSIYPAEKSFLINSQGEAAKNTSRPTPITPILAQQAANPRATPVLATSIPLQSSKPIISTTNNRINRILVIALIASLVIALAAVLMVNSKTSKIDQPIILTAPSVDISSNVKDILGKLGSVNNTVTKELDILLIAAETGKDAETLAIARTIFRDQSAPVLATIDKQRARDMNELGRQQNASGNAAQAFTTQLESFYLNPLDPEISANLSYFALQNRQQVLGERLAIYSLQISLNRNKDSWGRVFHWANLAVAMAQRGDTLNATRVLWLLLAATSDLEKTCNSILVYEKTFGSIMRQPTIAFFDRIQKRSQTEGKLATGSCASPPLWR